MIISCYNNRIFKGANMKKYFLYLLSFFILVGCTTYQPEGFTGGFSEIQLGENIFQVSFRGNGYTSSERASDFCLLRCAELTLEKGYSYFAIIESEKTSKTSTYTTPTNSSTSINVYPSNNQIYGTSQTRTTGGETYTVSKPRSTNIIICFKEKSEADGIIYDISYIIPAIRQKYNITK